MKTFLKVFALGVVVILGFGFSLWYDRIPVLIQSLESKTVDGGPVFNRINWISEPGRDIWIMQQSHWGPHPHQWDHLMIVVNKMKVPKVARFYQLDENGVSQEFRISCFMCHSNGPRAIRPDFASADAHVSPWERAKLTLWNLRIKSYGRIASDPFHEKIDPYLRVPFRRAGVFENQTLKVKTCVHCHRETGWIARGALTRQNFMAIQFMVESGNMPPFGFRLPANERKQVDEFILGL